MTVPPALGAVAAAFNHLFVIDDPRLFVILRSTVSEAIAEGLARPWSPTLARYVKAVVMAAGGHPSTVRKLVYLGVRPRHREDRAEALRRSRELRRTARHTVMDPALVDAARTVMRK